MSLITFHDNKTLEIPPQKAIRLMLIRRGLVKGSPEVIRYLQRVKDISFETTNRPVIVEQRLPYAD